MIQDFYVQHEGKVVGPATAKQLKVLASQGKIHGETLIRAGESGNWVPASRIKGLFAAIAKIDPGPATSIATSSAAAAPAAPSVFNQAQSPSELAKVQNVPIVQSTDSRLSKFISDGQPPKVVGKLLGRVHDICVDSEIAEYIAVQHLPSVMSPDAIVLTNRRVIIFRAKSLGRMEMVDVPWLHLGNIHIKEGIVGATLSVTGTNGHVETLDHLPKAQARSVYRVGQQREEEVREQRRQRMMEEQRNAASNVTVNTNVSAAVPEAQPPHMDLTARLSQLKSMLDAGLIDQSEFDTKKAEILASL